MYLNNIDWLISGFSVMLGLNPKQAHLQTDQRDLSIPDIKFISRKDKPSSSGKNEGEGGRLASKGPLKPIN